MKFNIVSEEELEVLQEDGIELSTNYRHKCTRANMYELFVQLRQIFQDEE